MSLRLLSIIFSIAIIGVSAFYYANWTLGALIMMGPPALVAFLWDCVDTVCLCVRSRSGAHPRACLIVDLLLFLALGAMSSVIAFTISKLDDSGFYFAFFQDGRGKEYLYIVLVFGVLATLVHLGTFVMAWYEIKSRPAAKPQIIYVQGNFVPQGNQQSQMAPLSTDPPPAYDLQSQQVFPHQFQDQIRVAELATPSSIAQEKKA
ncbi:hypothetical protein BKA56DRAFT_668304 [Ilyonectria sp. MPI-CAGE-AT-0026]|nr:hypothetical protein BKA56DRAFT_668304 [Ilyonectria sp. MPI-CAGE-AT-0026]